MVFRMIRLGQPQGSPVPSWIIFVRLAQAVAALIIAILTAVAASKFLQGSDVQYLVSSSEMFKE